MSGICSCNAVFMSFTVSAAGKFVNLCNRNCSFYFYLILLFPEQEVRLARPTHPNFQPFRNDNVNNLFKVLQFTR